MTDSFIASTTSFFAGATQNDKDQSSFELKPPRSPNNLPQSPRHLNLREALEWLLGAAPTSEDEVLSHEEKQARRNRRMELLMWILNLEPRLAPYGE